MKDSFKETATILALENATTYNGKANAKALIGKLMPQFPQMKDDMKSYMKTLEEVTREINELSPEEQKEKLLKLNPAFDKEQEEKKKSRERKAELPDLPMNSEKEDIVVRFSPAPSGNLHLGHLFPLLYNYLYKKKYNGKMILRLEDTNPEKIAKENYDRIIEDCTWLTQDGIDEIVCQSDRLELYYKELEKLLQNGHAYVCSCAPDDFKNYNDNSQACPHRTQTPEEALKLYKNMKEGIIKEGEAAIRFKADLENKNPALRDFPIARVKEAEHVRLGNSVKLWPMYNLCVSIDDALMNVTHVIRGKDHEINGFRQDMIKDALNLRKSYYIVVGRINFTDIELSKSKLTIKVENKEVSGWDDPRMPTVIAFRKRGFRAKAFEQLILNKGISKRDSTISKAEFMKSLEFYNKQILDKEADRAYCITEPKKLHISNIKDIKRKDISIAYHPEDEGRGKRTVPIEEDYLVEGRDFDALETNNIFRLLHFGNFKVIEKKEDTLNCEFLGEELDKNLKLSRSIHYLSTEDKEDCEIVLPDASKVSAFSSKTGKLRKGQCLQFERYGFCCFDHEEENGVKVYYFTQN